MRLKNIFSFLGCFLSFTLVADAAVLSGVITDETGPAAGARVTIPSLRRAAVADDQGRYEIKDMPPGVYAVDVVGVHGRAVRTVDLVEGDVSLDVSLEDAFVTLPAITLTASSLAREVLESPQSVAVVEGRELDRVRAQTVTETVAETPGVNAQTLGSGIAKPVIRGLTSQRSAVVVDGVKDETHQWGDEHGPLVDAMDVERIEVLRGPQSLLYGSDALGGVLHVVRKPLPSVEAGDPRLGGRTTFNAFSNSDQIAANLALEGASGAAGYRANVTVRDAGEIRTPTKTRGLVEHGGKLHNSAAEELNGALSVGASGNWGSVVADYSRFSSELGIPVVDEESGHDHEHEPHQKLNRDAVGLRASFNAPFARLDLNLNQQENRRREFEEGDEAELDLILNARTGTFLAHHAPLSLGGHAHLTGTLGLEFQQQKNKSRGEEALIPDYTQDNAAFFVNEEVRLGRVTLLAGMRSDRRTLKAEENGELGSPSETRKYDAVTGAGGAVVRILDNLSAAAHLGRGWRAPVAQELYAEGEHHGTHQYLVGDATLGVETSLNTDVSLRWASRLFRAEATVFRNKVKDFIYASDTGTDTGAPEFLPVFQYAQADATLRGAELSFQARPWGPLTFEGGWDMVRGTNDETGTPLPRIPASRILAGVRVSGEDWGALQHPYAGVKVRRVAAQKRLDANEASSQSYVLWGLSTGCEVFFGGHELSIDMGVNNLFDRAYADHLNLFREHALNPGRDVWVKLSMPFTLVR